MMVRSLISLGDGEPVEVFKHRSDVLTAGGACEKTGNRILNILEFIKEFDR